MTENKIDRLSKGGVIKGDIQYEEIDSSKKYILVVPKEYSKEDFNNIVIGLTSRGLDNFLVIHAGSGIDLTVRE